MKTIMDLSTEQLREIPLFSELRDDDITELLAASSMHSIAKGEHVFRAADTYRGFYIVLSGRVKIYRMSEAGKETILHVIAKMQALAEVPMFLGGGYPADAVAMEDSTLLLLSKDGFLSRLYMYPDIAVKMLAGLSKRLRHLGSLVENLTLFDVRTRLIRFLLDEYDAHPSDTVPRVELRTSKSFLATQLGTILETLSRTLHKLQEEGLIRVRGKKIFLENLPELRRHAKA